MKRMLILLTLSTKIACLVTLNSPETLVEDSIKILEQEHLFFKSLSAYGYIYNLATTVPQIINSGAAIPFSSHSNLVGITHTAVTSAAPPSSINAQIGIVAPGTYFVSFVVYANQTNQFALFLQQSGVSSGVLCNTNYGVATAYAPNSGFAIITTTVANAILTLVSYTPFASQGTPAQTVLAYNNSGGLLCNGTATSTSANSSGTATSSFNGGVQINTINAAVYIQKID